jgi:hypothetical protein
MTFAYKIFAIHTLQTVNVATLEVMFCSEDVETERVNIPLILN